MQNAVTAPCHERAPVQAHSADTFGGPIGVAAEQGVVFRCSQKANDPQFLGQLIPKFLSAGFLKDALIEVSLDIDIQEARYAANGHCRAVGFLDCAEISEIGPLEGLARVRRRAADVAFVKLRHRREVVQRAHLFGQFLARAYHLVVRPHVVELGPFGALGFEETVDAI